MRFTAYLQPLGTDHAARSADTVFLVGADLRLVVDATLLPSVAGAQACLCVELKPKCGFLPQQAWPEHGVMGYGHAGIGLAVRARGQGDSTDMYTCV